MSKALLFQARGEFIAGMLKGGLLTVDSKGVPANADSGNRRSVKISSALLSLMGKATVATKAAGQTSGQGLQDHVERFLQTTFPRLGHLRPGRWEITQRKHLDQFAQFAHLAELAKVMEKHPEVRAALGGEYMIEPDVVVMRLPESDKVINRPSLVVDDSIAMHAELREVCQPLPLLHASVSCKFTLRSDRAQNVRVEAQNLLRNRKGRVPHIVAVTAEPTFARIAALALGTADLDCVYHVALHELLEATNKCGEADEGLHLMELVGSKRLKDISDLPLDLAV